MVLLSILEQLVHIKRTMHISFCVLYRNWGVLYRNWGGQVGEDWEGLQGSRTCYGLSLARKHLFLAPIMIFAPRLMRVGSRSFGHFLTLLPDCVAQLQNPRVNVSNIVDRHDSQVTYFANLPGRPKFGNA